MQAFHSHFIKLCLALNSNISVERSTLRWAFILIQVMKVTEEQEIVRYLLKTPYLRQSPPKTLDRDDFDHLLEHVEGCSPADGAATLTAFVVECIVRSILFLPSIPNHWVLTGGGTFNPTLVLAIKRALKDRVQTFSELNLPHYNLEATGYAFLAVRHLAGLPITFPETTGVKEPITGGIYHNITD